MTRNSHEYPRWSAAALGAAGLAVVMFAAAAAQAESPDRPLGAPGVNPNAAAVTARPALLTQKGPHTLRLVVTGLRSRNGTVLCKLYDPSGKYPSSSMKGARGARATPVATGDGLAAICTFRNLVAGRYAAAIAHDENGNGKVDRTMIGLPKEGYGFSNNARVSITGAPSFRRASFAVNGDTRHEVRVVYP